jgi:hypothetical protein
MPVHTGGRGAGGVVSRPTVDFSPADALAPDSALLSPVELAVLGVPVRFETNSRYVLDCIDESFGEWRNVTPDSRAVDPLRVRLIAYGGREGGDEWRDVRVPVRHTCPDSTRLIAHSPGSIGISDPARREAVAHVSTELAADRAHFRSAMIEALTLALVTQFDRPRCWSARVPLSSRARSTVRWRPGPTGSLSAMRGWSACLPSAAAGGCACRPIRWRRCRSCVACSTSPDVRG